MKVAQLQTLIAHEPELLFFRAIAHQKAQKEFIYQGRAWAIDRIGWRLPGGARWKLVNRRAVMALVPGRVNHSDSSSGQ
jgi:hypothetical protein